MLHSSFKVTLTLFRYFFDVDGRDERQHTFRRLDYNHRDAVDDLDCWCERHTHLPQRLLQRQQAEGRVAPASLGEGVDQALRQRSAGISEFLGLQVARILLVPPPDLDPDPRLVALPRRPIPVILVPVLPFLAQPAPVLGGIELAAHLAAAAQALSQAICAKGLTSRKAGKGGNPQIFGIFEELAISNLSASSLYCRFQSAASVR